MGRNAIKKRGSLDAAKALLKAGGIPWHIVVNHEVAELKIDALAGGFGGDANLYLETECFLGAFTLVRIHSAADFAGGVSPALQMFL